MITINTDKPGTLPSEFVNVENASTSCVGRSSTIYDIFYSPFIFIGRHLYHMKIMSGKIWWIRFELLNV